MNGNLKGNRMNPKLNYSNPIMESLITSLGCFAGTLWEYQTKWESYYNNWESYKLLLNGKLW